MLFYNKFRLRASDYDLCSIDEFKLPPIKEPADNFYCNIHNYYHPYSNCKSIKSNLKAFQQP